MIAGIILAGGESRRMGFPKLSLELKGRTLLEHAVLKAQSVTDSVIVVVGAYPDIYGPIAKSVGAQVISNPDWKEGLGSTLKVGVRALSDDYTAVLALLADQPFVTQTHLHELIKKQKESQADLVFSSYDGVKGPPVFINKTLIPAAKVLKGSCGAKALIQPDSNVETIALEQYFDIDTPEDAERFALQRPT